MDATPSPSVLVPFAAEESLTIGEAAAIVGKRRATRRTERTIRNWCIKHGIGQRLAGGRWIVSKPALLMLLQGDYEALIAYRGGDQRGRWFSVDDLAEQTFAKHQPTSQPQALLTLQPINTEALGTIEPIKPTPDEVCASVAQDPEVLEAVRCLDRATPSTHYDVVRARDEAQARMGIPVGDRAFLYSAEVDDCLLPIVVRMWPGDEAATVQALRRDFDERYGDLSSRVLEFCLRTFQHGNIDSLKRAAGVA